MPTEDTSAPFPWPFHPIMGGAPEGDPEPPPAEPAAPEGEPSAEDSFTENFKPEDLPEEAREAYEAAYKSMQSDYTKKTQAIAESQQEAEQAQALVQALQDPSLQTQALQYLGLELAEDPPPAGEGDDDLLPEEALAKRMEALESQISERDQNAEMQALQDAEDEHILGQIETLAKDHGEFNDHELQLLYTHSLANRKADGEPDVKAAYEALKSAEEAAHERYVESKRAPKVGVGTAGTKKVDLNDDDARQALMTDIMNEQAELAT